MSIQELVIYKNILYTLINESAYPENHSKCIAFLYNILECCKNKICRNELLDRDFIIFHQHLQSCKERIFFDKWFKEMNKRKKFIDRQLKSIIIPDISDELLPYYQTAFNTQTKMLITQDPELLIKADEIFQDFGIQTLSIDKANLKVIEFQREKSTEDQILTEVINRISKYRGKELNLSDYMMFLDQIQNFTKNEAHYRSIRNSMVKLLKRTKEYYFTFEEMSEKLNEIIDGIIVDNDYFFVVFDESWEHSDNFWTYYITKINNSTIYRNKMLNASKLIEVLKSEDIDESNQMDIIFIDDVIGTGNTFVKRYEKNLKEELEGMGEEITKYINFYLISGIGSVESMKLIQQKTPLTRNSIRYCKTIRNEDKAFSNAQWADHDELNKLKEFLKTLDPSHCKGFFGTEEYLVVLEWNTPNSTISCLWKNSIEQNGKKWIPLYPRA